MYNYDATDEDELSIVKGDIIAVIEELDEGWWVGEQTNSSGKRGMFPANYCKSCDPPVTTPVVAAAAPTYPSMPSVATAAVACLPYVRQTSVASISGGGSSSAPPPRPTGAKPPSTRPATATTATPPPIATTIANVTSAVSSSGPTGHAYLPASIMSAQNGPPSSSIGPCSQCGCTEFSPNVFKKGSCNNCFHKH